MLYTSICTYLLSDNLSIYLSIVLCCIHLPVATTSSSSLSNYHSIYHSMLFTSICTDVLCLTELAYVLAMCCILSIYPSIYLSINLCTVYFVKYISSTQYILSFILPWWYGPNASPFIAYLSFASKQEYSENPSLVFDKVTRKQVLVDLSHDTKNEVINTRNLVIVFTTEAAEGWRTDMIAI